jgi:hypothetical protein
MAGSLAYTRHTTVHNCLPQATAGQPHDWNWSPQSVTVTGTLYQRHPKRYGIRRDCVRIGLVDSYGIKPGGREQGV